MRKYITIENYLKSSITIQNSNNRKKIIRYIFSIICLSIILFSVCTILKWCIDNLKVYQINKEIKENINVDTTSKQGELVNPPSNFNSDYYYYTNFNFYQVDFSVLSVQNSDTVGFIHINNTNINYPIVQTNDNNYYLTHSFNKSSSSAGWVFMDYRNNIDNLGYNTIIYGHARLDGTMFGSLKNTLSSKWQSNRDNYIIFLSTLNENMLFQIFSIYVVELEDYYIKTNFSNVYEKQMWIDTMKKRNIAPIDTEVNINDKILTLSTCKNQQDKRIVVQAKLIKRQKR